MKPRRLRSKFDRECARNTRDQHWDFMEKVQRLGVVWWCIWNKKKMPELQDEHRCSLISGMELNEWIHRHRDWWRIGKWDEARYACPVRLTTAGRQALRDRARYDMEDVTGGLVEPGFIVTPARRKEVPA
jgi:hypothetical protein